MKFRLETEFQETEVGKIPREWKIVKLGDIAQIIMGQSPPSHTYNKDGVGLPFLQGKMEFGRIYPSPAMYTTQPIKIAEPNDVLISVRAPVGDVNIAPHKICIGRGLAALRFDPKMANYMFYFYYFQFVKERLEALGKGSTFKAITKKDLNDLGTVYPPINEQMIIAKTLLTVDKAIELYYEEKTKLEGLKKALMNRLLTGRIRVREEKGKLVFYRETQFQETEIGKIPKEWRVVKLKSIAVEIKSGFASGKRDEVDGTIHLRMFNISLDGMLSFDEIIKVPKPKNWRQYLLRHGDILLVNTSGSKEHIGKVAIFEDVKLECTYSNHLTRIRIDENKVDSRWVYFVLYYLWQTGYFKSLVHQQAGGQRNIPLKAIENLPIMLPPTSEARKIAELLSMINTAMKLYHEERVRLDSLKKSLMDLLLTGKVRVVE